MSAPHFSPAIRLHLAYHDMIVSLGNFLMFYSFQHGEYYLFIILMPTPFLGASYSLVTSPCRLLDATWKANLGKLDETCLTPKHL